MANEEFSVAHVRRKEDVLFSSPFCVSDEKFLQYFGFNKPDGYKLMNELAASGRFNAVVHAATDEILFDVSFFSSLCYLHNGTLNQLVKYHPAYKDRNIKQLIEKVPVVCQTIILLWSEKYVKCPTTKEDLRPRLRGFSSLNCPQIIGIVNAYRFYSHCEVKAIYVTNAEKKIKKSAHLNVQLACDERGVFVDVFATLNPLINLKPFIWQLSNYRNMLQGLKAHYNDLFVVTGSNEYTCDENDMLLRPGQPKNNINFEYDPDVVRILEDAVAELRDRFKLLTNVIPFHLQESYYIVNACIILHNFIKLKINVKTTHK